jgi:hypothetical protein
MFVVKFYFTINNISQLNTFMRKEKDPEPLPDPYLWLTDPNADPAGP